MQLARVIFGTSSLGNLYTVPSDEVKLAVVKAIFENSPKPVVFDSAGKYGAGLALEALGKCLKQLGIKPDEVVISNKMAWYQTELKTPEPTFEPGVWRDLKNDAVQKVSYQGMLDCFEQGNQLLNGYIPQLVSVHDPDEYLAAAQDEADAEQRYQDILDSYRALAELKAQGKVKAIGVGSKDWKIIERIDGDVNLDWVMIANSMTIKQHPANLWQFMQKLKDKGVQIINSAVFNGGFLTGGDYYNYKLVTADDEEGKALLQWRDDFFALCNKYHIKPAEACVQFGLRAPGVTSIALSTTNPDRVKSNIDMAHVQVPEEFWQEMKTQKLIDPAINF
ncbi:aldo/keto reductase [Mucilaginibacter robiniae]|uniref:Aldo/keto reductase n=1 Tax=Mucilaginibacter robiniae TaxID=2728022 RepID=A0A7L5E1M8_9SPHI|nr:aldo/keto reductase [Mucilaginibacter robiniae]QJD97272.1 aldo/keto reductase [Mucilaginibacter robiniae]